ncbi:hypothetical protein Rcae01_04742 [Novipirellula caenicola]|uniref:Uncharacterized protein n=1 Tax=Novipirellula caenicola TaxID=1536901 RepID=A0ABP9W055_9BACT
MSWQKESRQRIMSIHSLLLSGNRERSRNPERSGNRDTVHRDW